LKNRYITISRSRHYRIFV